MAKSFENLRRNMSAARKAANQAKAGRIVSEIALRELRKSLNLTQAEVAKLLNIKQASLSRLEHQKDMYISTLSRFVAALGGNLKLVASFEKKDVVLKEFAG